jgi:hypothetical protein
MKFKRMIIVITVIAAMLSLTACGSKNGDEATTETSTEATTNAALKEIDFDAEGIATKFLNDFQSGSFEAVLADYDYADAMKEQFTIEAMEEISKQLLQAYGSFIDTHGIKSQQNEEYHIVTIGANHENKDLAYNVVFTFDGKIAGFNYQEISSVEDYFDGEVKGAIETEVTFGEADFLIEGTLSIPEGDAGPYPVVVLVHGSGPNDRNESIYGNKPFKDIAGGLIKQGIAVLRYDKRTFTHIEKFNDPALVADFTIYDEVIDDAKYAVEFLSTYDGIDADNIYVVGHSLGGNQAPRIAKDNDLVAGIALMASNVTPLQNLIVKQYEYLLGLDGSMSDGDNQQLESIKKAADLISSDAMTLETNMNDTMGLSPKYWMDIKTYDPVSEAKALDIPILVLQGARDYQVTASEFEKWQAELGTDGEYKLYDDLNHLFMTGEGMSKPEEYTAAGNVSEQVIIDIANWVKENSK